MNDDFWKKVTVVMDPGVKKAWGPNAAAKVKAKLREEVEKTSRKPRAGDVTNLGKTPKQED